MEKKSNVTKWFVLFISVLIVGFIGSTYFAADRDQAIQDKYDEEIATLTQQYEQEIKAIRDEKAVLIAELKEVEAKRKFTVKQLKDKQNENNEQISITVSSYKPDAYDSIIHVLFSDLSRFD
jgi:uncharacterized membrane protein YvbJ